MNFRSTVSALILAGFLSPLYASGQSGQRVVPDNWTLPVARINARVNDEQGMALSGAAVSLAFSEPRGGSSGAPKSGLTDAAGLFSSEGHTDGVVGTTCTKEGYYVGCIPVPHFTNVVNDRWQPWDATYTTVLRKIENPVNMYARRAVMKAPVVDKACGYDLKVGDWVSPWGKGLVADFVFTVTCEYTNSSHYNVTMKLSCSNPLDGIQAAELPKEYVCGLFVWHRQAPDTGYVSHYEQERGIPKKRYQIPSAPAVRDGEDIEKQKFYFRVRTVEKDGKIVSALYGKLSQGFDLWASNSTNVSIRTCYYLNPTPLDRNMEFDLKKNLFKNLKPEEQARRP
jgi:hypothetical protein